mgnify:CR=1 FL=1
MVSMPAWTSGVQTSSVGSTRSSRAAASSPATPPRDLDAPLNLSKPRGGGGSAPQPAPPSAGAPTAVSAPPSTPFGQYEQSVAAAAYPRPLYTMPRSDPPQAPTAPPTQMKDEPDYGTPFNSECLFLRIVL